MARESVTITGLHLIISGGSEYTPPETVQVALEIDGRWRLVLSEPCHAPTSIIIEPNGIQTVTRMQDEQKKQETE